MQRMALQYLAKILAIFGLAKPNLAMSCSAMSQAMRNRDMQSLAYDGLDLP